MTTIHRYTSGNRGWARNVTINGVKYDEVHYEGDVPTHGFLTLHEDEREHGAKDDLCGCPWCSEDGKTPFDNVDGVWDTKVIDLRTGQEHKCHFPALYRLRRQPYRTWDPSEELVKLIEADEQDKLGPFCPPECYEYGGTWTASLTHERGALVVEWYQHGVE